MYTVHEWIANNQYFNVINLLINSLKKKKKIVLIKCIRKLIRVIPLNWKTNQPVDLSTGSDKPTVRRVGFR